MAGGRRIDLVAWQRTSWWRPAIRVAAALGPFLTCAVLSTDRGDVPDAIAVLLLVIWVVAGAATGDRIAAFTAALSGGVWFDFFLVPPYLTLSIDDHDDMVATVLLVVIGVAVTELALWGHRQQAQASRRSGYLDGVLSTATAVTEGSTPTSAVVDVVARQICEVLDADDCVFADGPVRDGRVAVLDRDGEVIRGGRHVDVDRLGLPTDEYVAVLVGRADRVLGHFLVTAATRVSRPTTEQRRVAVLLADQVAIALGGATSR